MRILFPYFTFHFQLVKFCTSWGQSQLHWHKTPYHDQVTWTDFRLENLCCHQPIEKRNVADRNKEIESEQLLQTDQEQEWLHVDNSAVLESVQCVSSFTVEKDLVRAAVRLSHLNESEGERNQQLSIQLKVNLKKTWYVQCTGASEEHLCICPFVLCCHCRLWPKPDSCNQKSGDYNLFASLNQCSLFLQSALNYNAGLHLHF